MKLGAKRISPKENLTCAHLKHELVPLLLAAEVCQKIYIYITGTSGKDNVAQFMRGVILSALTLS